MHHHITQLQSNYFNYSFSRIQFFTSFSHHFIIILYAVICDNFLRLRNQFSLLFKIYTTRQTFPLHIQVMKVVTINTTTSTSTHV